MLTSKQNNNIDTNNWVDVRNVQDKLELSQHYADICQQHHFEKKWILMINPEDDSLTELSSEHNIDASKILRVDAKDINISKIETVLSNGNCAAVVLCNHMFAQEQLSNLVSFAKRGNTHCVVMNNKKNIH